MADEAETELDELVTETKVDPRADAECTVVAARWLVVVLSVSVAAAAAESQPMLLNLMPVRC
eukprot:9390502-Pyramimonas_sp.AAC.1